MMLKVYLPSKCNIQVPKIREWAQCYWAAVVTKLIKWARSYDGQMPKAMRTYARVQRLSSVRHQLFPLNDFFSRPTWPFSTKVCGKHAWGMGIHICSNKGSGPFWDPIRGKIRKKMKNLLVNH